jgi:5-methylcytosine-specific restriction enzyme A
MPWKAKHPCRYPGCGTLVSGAYCDTHKPAVGAIRDAGGQSARERGYDHRWNAARLQYLNAHPLCAACLARGRVVPATVVDHIVPHRGDKERFWDEANWRALCKSCHDQKTAREDGGFGNLTKDEKRR